MKDRLMDLAMEAEIEHAVKAIKRRYKAEQKLWDEISSNVTVRDTEWLSVKNRKEVKESLGTGWYLGWCLCWEIAYREGLKAACSGGKSN